MTCPVCWCHMDYHHITPDGMAVQCMTWGCDCMVDIEWDAEA